MSTTNNKCKNIIIITSDFLPTPSANGVCAFNLSKVLMERGYSVDVISNRKCHQKKIEILDDITIHRVPVQLIAQFIKNKKLQILVLRINLMLHFFMYPLVSIFEMFRYIHIVNRTIRKKEITILLAINNPLVGCLSGVFSKRKFKERLKFVLYDVDSFSNTLEGRFISLPKKKKMMWKWEKMIFSSADLAIVMQNHKEHYYQERYRQFNHKIKIANFPMLYTHLSNKQRQPTKYRTTKCVYLGTLSQTYRNPKIVCDLFSKISNVNLSFLGKIDDSETIIRKYSEETRGRIHHGGMVSFLQGQESLQNADILISIGNRDSDMVPSKTFEYISFCKPIIHFYTFKEDPVIPTLDKYPIALLLDASESIQALVDKTKDFLSANIGKTVDPKMIRELFYENTPEYSIDLIENCLLNHQ